MPRTVRLLCASAFLFAGFGAAAPAMAQRGESEVVYYGDLDLWSEDGADSMVRRLQRAANHVCGGTEASAPLAQQADVRGCEFETTEFAIEDLAHPMVTARYYGRTPEVLIEEGSADPYRDDPYYTVHKK